MSESSDSLFVRLCKSNRGSTVTFMYSNKQPMHQLRTHTKCSIKITQKTAQKRPCTAPTNKKKPTPNEMRKECAKNIIHKTTLTHRISRSRRSRNFWTNPCTDSILVPFTDNKTSPLAIPARPSIEPGSNSSTCK